MFSAEYVEEVGNRKPPSGWPSKYGALREVFPYHYLSFKAMITRALKYGNECGFSRSKEDLVKFILIMGTIPDNMNKPTVGRYRHEIGYVFDAELDRWNFRWQPHKENCADGGTRADHALGGRICGELGRAGLQTGAAHKENSRNIKGDVLKGLLISKHSRGEAVLTLEEISKLGYSNRDNLWRILKSRLKTRPVSLPDGSIKLDFSQFTSGEL